jgi:hypothetical protein
LAWDSRIGEAVDDLEQRWQAFSELRDVLRLTNAELPRSDNQARQRLLPEIELLRLQKIEKQVEEYTSQLGRRLAAEPSKDSPHAIILKYLNRYGQYLFGHPAVRDPDGSVLKVVERTNNVLEHFFGQGKQRLRRRLGRANLARDLAQQPAQAVLAANLCHPDYVRALCGTLERLPAAFAALDARAIGKATPLCRDHRDSKLWRKIQSLLQASENPRPVPATATSSPHLADQVLVPGASAGAESQQRPGAAQIR